MNAPARVAPAPPGAPASTRTATPAAARAPSRAPARALLALYAQPERAPSLAPHEWMDVLGAARRARCLGHLGLRLGQAGVLARIEPRVAGHFRSAEITIARHRRALRWELRELAQALQSLPGPVVALKGVAYELEALPLASARVASDVDLLVPTDAIAACETRLKAHGWESVELDDYDERYYREWSHEIPALVHPERGFEVDVHHSIAPGLSGDAPAARALVDASRPAPWTWSARGLRCDRFRVLSPLDQLAHVAIHTFAGSDLALRLREVMDFDLLYRHRAGEGAGCDAAAVLERASALGLGRPAWWMLHCARRWLGTPVDEAALARSPLRPAGAARVAMDALLDRAMLPGLRQRRSHREFAAETLLLARYQWQRLPLHRLVPHVIEKARRRVMDRET